MPYLNLKTNGVDEAFDAGRICADASKICAEALGKSEEYMMVSLESVRDMSFGGSTGPAIFVELRSIGLPEGSQAVLSSELCNLLSERLDVPQSRIYLNFVDISRENWGWNGKTFV